VLCCVVDKLIPLLVVGLVCIDVGQEQRALSVPVELDELCPVGIRDLER